jgi:hypothetical protein
MRFSPLLLVEGVRHHQHESPVCCVPSHVHATDEGQSWRDAAAAHLVGIIEPVVSALSAAAWRVARP